MFNLDWYDEQAAIVRKYMLYYHPVQNQIEMYDIKNQRIFLKKMEVPGVSLEDFYIGSKVTILSRVMKVTDYSDARTANHFNQSRTHTFAMIKPHAYQHFGKILEAVTAAGFSISKLKMSKFTPQTCAQFYAEHVGKPFYPNLESAMCSDVCIGMELVACDAVNKWR